jgi:hypothetical protein
MDWKGPGKKLWLGNGGIYWEGRRKIMRNFVHNNSLHSCRDASRGFPESESTNFTAIATLSFSVSYSQARALVRIILEESG